MENLKDTTKHYQNWIIYEREEQTVLQNECYVHCTVSCHHTFLLPPPKKLRFLPHCLSFCLSTCLSGMYSDDLIHLMVVIEALIKANFNWQYIPQIMVL